MKLNRSDVVMVSVASWMLLQVSQLLSISDYSALQEIRESGGTAFNQILGLAILLACVGTMLFTKIPRTLASLTVQQKVFLALIVYFFTTSQWSIEPNSSAIYAAILMLVSLAIMLISRNNLLPKALALSSVFLAGFFIWAIFKLGISGRFIGGNQPNLLAAIAFAGLVFSFLIGAKIVRFMVIIFFISIIYLLGSRTYLLGTVLFLMALLALYSQRRFVVLLLISLIAVLAIAAFPPLAPEAITVIVNEFLATGDQARGVSSGFTGRADHWLRGLHLFVQSPIVGYGFRTRESIFSIVSVSASAHSGFINLLIDTGLIGFCLFIFVLLTSIFRRYLDARQREGISLRTRESLLFNRLMLAAWPALILMLVGEPTHLYTAMPHHSLLLIALIGFEGKRPEIEKRSNEIAPVSSPK